jgi:hypothetical protein
VLQEIVVDRVLEIVDAGIAAASDAFHRALLHNSDIGGFTS